LSFFLFMHDYSCLIFFQSCGFYFFIHVYSFINVCFLLIKFLLVLQKQPKIERYPFQFVSCIDQRISIDFCLFYFNSCLFSQYFIRVYLLVCFVHSMTVFFLFSFIHSFIHVYVYFYSFMFVLIHSFMFVFFYL